MGNPGVDEAWDSPRVPAPIRQALCPGRVRSCINFSSLCNVLRHCSMAPGCYMQYLDNRGSPMMPELGFRVLALSLHSTRTLPALPLHYHCSPSEWVGIFENVKNIIKPMEMNT